MYRDILENVVLKFYVMKKLFIGAVGAMSVLLSASPAMAEEVLTKEKMLENMTELGVKSQQICDLLKTAYEEYGLYPQAECDTYFETTLILIDSVSASYNYNDALYHYKSFVNLNNDMSKVFKPYMQ